MIFTTIVKQQSITANKMMIHSKIAKQKLKLKVNMLMMQLQVLDHILQIGILVLFNQEIKT